jgi:phosphatidylglycerophosphate synthase
VNGTHYQPHSRRPISEVFRRTARGAVGLCVRTDIHADTISYLSIVVSALAGLCFWLARLHPWLLIVGPTLCYVRLWFNMLDGMVALASHEASPHGEILNDLPDRISDALVFAGVARSGLASPDLAYGAAIFALLTAYVGMLGQAVGAHREFSGVMAKPWRVVALHAGAWITLGALSNERSAVVSGLTILDWTCLVVMVGCIETIAIRLHRITGALEAAAAPGETR